MSLVGTDIDEAGIAHGAAQHFPDDSTGSKPTEETVLEEELLNELNKFWANFQQIVHNLNWLTVDGPKLRDVHDVLCAFFEGTKEDTVRIAKLLPVCNELLG